MVPRPVPVAAQRQGVYMPMRRQVDTAPEGRQQQRPSILFRPSTPVGQQRRPQPSQVSRFLC